MESPVRALTLCVLLVVSGCAGSPVATDGDGPMSVSTDTPSPTAGISSTAVDAPPSPTAKPDGIEATVIEIVDGDTVDVRLANGSEDTVRLLGVDTPEVHTANDPSEFEGVPDTKAGRDCLHEWGERASDHATTQLLGKTVTLSFDENEPHRGYYGRLLSYIHVDGASFNYGLITNGLARKYDDSQFQYSERYQSAEDAATDGGAGLWSACVDGEARTVTETPIAIADGGTPLRLVEIHADAEGDDSKNLNDEYLVFSNAGTEEIDISGWTVSDEANHQYTFPKGTTIGANETLTLHTGSGEDSNSDNYWGEASPVWNNDGDVVTVRTENGSVVIERSDDG